MQNPPFNGGFFTKTEHNLIMLQYAYPQSIRITRCSRYVKPVEAGCVNGIDLLICKRHGWISNTVESPIEGTYFHMIVT
jgi:hypothetical protein